MTRPATWKLLCNALALNLGWLAGVLGAAAGRPLAGCGVIALLLLGHLLLQRHRWRCETALLLGAGLLGYLADTTLVMLQALAFPQPDSLLPPTTLWMVALWLNFATGLNLALYWLAGRHWLAAALGFVGGPLAYWSGAQFGAILLPAKLLPALLLIGLVWAAALVVLVSFNDWLKPVTSTTKHAGERE